MASGSNFLSASALALNHLSIEKALMIERSLREIIFSAISGVVVPMGTMTLCAQELPANLSGGSAQDSTERPMAGQTLTRTSFRIIRDVAYLAPDQTEKLDLYLPSRDPHDSPSAAVIWMHGNHHDKGDAREHNVCETLASAGYVCASINYGTWPDSDNAPDAPPRIQQNIANAKTAVRFLRVYAKDYHIDPARIAAFGGSAGGFLALMLGLTNDVAGFEHLGPYQGVSSAVGAIGDFYGDFDPPMKNQLTSKYPPILIVQGKDDPTVDYRQSAELVQAFAAKGVPHEFILLENVGHGFDLMTWKNKPLPRDLRPVVLAFLTKYLGPPPFLAPSSDK